MNKDILSKLSALYASYDGSLPWMEFIRRSKDDRDVWRIVAGMHHVKDQSDPWEFVTIWAPFMEKTSLVDDIWQFMREGGDAQDVAELDAGVWTIVQIQQRRGAGEYWMVDMHHKESKNITDFGITSLKRVDGKIMLWRDEEQGE